MSMFNLFCKTIQNFKKHHPTKGVVARSAFKLEFSELHIVPVQ